MKRAARMKDIAGFGTVTGDLGLRAAISDHIAARHGQRDDPECQIVVTCGGTEAGTHRGALSALGPYSAV